MRLAHVILPAVLLTAGIASPGSAQIQASELGSVSQVVDGTKFSVEYYRPRVRGRDSIFETQIFAEKVWTPGANWATTFELNKKIQLNGTDIPAGKYSTWFIFHDSTWTLLLDPRARRFHMNRPDSVAGQIKIEVTPETGPFTEVFAWTFPEVRVNGGKLRMNFATRQVTLDYRVEPSFEYGMPQQAARAYVGRYEFSWTPSPKDTTPPEVYKMDLQYRSGSLRATFDPAPDPTMQEVLLFSIRPNWFRMATLEKGEIFDVWTDAVFEFAVTNGRATGFEVRGDGDEVWGQAKRVR